MRGYESKSLNHNIKQHDIYTVSFKQLLILAETCETISQIVYR